MLERFRQFWTNVWAPLANLFLRFVWAPLANLFLRWGISPNTVTFVGTVGVVAGAVIFFPQGKLLIGVLVITAFVFSDIMDGYMARASGKVSTFGAFWDSTLDRIGDAAIFGGLAMYYVGPGDNDWLAALSIYCLSMGSVTSYARARAESLGMQAKVGIAERADRLVFTLVTTGLAALIDDLGGGDDWLVAIPIVLGLMAVANTVTVIQRVLVVRSQALAIDAARDATEN
jgi:CDP-diacylglycerol--glycerol-3-phosphate 3-phosphatidyltransferase/CDP-diacylglycerol--inositol 3-phosphatidyltransferase